MKWPTLIAACATTARAATLSPLLFGAKPDAQQFTCSTTTSGFRGASISLSPGDIGKVVALFHCGAATSGTNHQDYIGVLTAPDGTLNPAPSLVADGVSGWI